METDAPSRSSGVRFWLLVALGLGVVAVLGVYLWPSQSPAPVTQPSNQTRGARARARVEAIDPEDLQVRLDALKADRPGLGEAERNPFRFKPQAPTPAPPSPAPMQRSSEPTPLVPPGLPPAPTVPPIPLKFIGIVQRTGRRQVAALSDCGKSTFFGTEGEIIDGRYRLVKIGVESLVIEYANGTGRTTIALAACPAK